MRIRLRFAKLGKVRFTSHRDVARMWERALRRLELPVAYTEGFSPRPKLSFGLALSTGHESVAEYLDVELREEPDLSTLPAQLSEQLPAGIDVTAAAPLAPGSPSLQEDVTSCTWRIEVRDLDPADADQLVTATLAADELIVTRTRKGKEVTDDLRPAVLTVQTVGPTPRGSELEAELAVHPRSVRPAELLLALAPSRVLEEGRVIRTAQWIWRDGARLEPWWPSRQRRRVRYERTQMSDAPAPTPQDEPRNESSSSPEDDARKPRRRGSRGGRNRNRSRSGGSATPTDDAPATTQPARKPQIGDSRPAPPPASDTDGDAESASRRRRRRGGRGRGRGGSNPVEAIRPEAVELDAETLERRRGRERKGRPVGRYLMCVHAQPNATQIAVLEGRSLTEHYVARPQDDATQIHGNIYLGRVQNVLPGMEAAFVDIGTPKNAVLYRGDVQFDKDDVDTPAGDARIEHILKARQSIVCQVTKNPIGAKGARLTQEVSLPGRFVVLIPNSTTYGISKRLSDDERKRLRNILDKIKPAEHGLIVRTAAEGATREELERDVARLLGQWDAIDALAKRSSAPTLLYREPDMAVRVIREEFNSSYRGVVIDDPKLYEEVRDYVASITPELADRVELHDPAEEPLPLFETFHVHEQLHKALDRKVWLPSGGSLIIERTEALTVIDVNTGKNVGKTNLEETVFRNNLEAAEEVARQLRLRDIGGIIVIDFIDMEIKKNRDEVVRVFREALARDKTRTQVFDISELGLVEMTRKRIGEGLLESMSSTCPVCEGRGIVIDQELLG